MTGKSDTTRFFRKEFGSATMMRTSTQSRDKGKETAGAKR